MTWNRQVPASSACRFDEGEGGDHEPILGVVKGSLTRVWSTDIVVMVAMVTLCGTRIRYTRLLVHIVRGDLADGKMEIFLVVASMEC
jgi:hypothetical protein